MDCYGENDFSHPSDSPAPDKATENADASPLSAPDTTQGEGACFARSEDTVAGASHRRVTNGYAVAGMVFAFLLAPLGLILGITGLVKSKKTDIGGKGLSIAAIVVSVVVTVACVTVFLLIYFIAKGMALALVEAVRQMVGADASSFFSNIL